MDTPRPLLTRLRAENVRSFATLDLELGPLTVLVGPNGAGKSNVVELLRFFRDSSVRGADAAMTEQRGWDFFHRRGGGDSIIGSSFSLPAEIDSVSVETENFVLSPEQGENLEIALLPYKGHLDTLTADLSRIGSTGITFSSDSNENTNLVNFVNRLFIYIVQPITLRDRTQRASRSLSLLEDMSNLGAVLLAIRETPFGDEVDRALALLVDGVTGYRVLQAGSTLVPQILYGPDDARDLGLESDGTIRLVALLAALYQPVPPSLIVLEEPEMGLHPGVLGALAEIIDEATLRMQVLVTTHSPDLIDRFDPDVIRIVEKVNGESVIGRVDPEQRDLIHKRLYRPSELMRMEGLVREPG